MLQDAVQILILVRQVHQNVTIVTLCIALQAVVRTTNVLLRLQRAVIQEV